MSHAGSAGCQGAVDQRSAQAASGQPAEGFSDVLMDLRGELAQVNLSPSMETFALMTELYVLAGDIKVPFISDHCPTVCAC